MRYIFLAWNFFDTCSLYKGLNCTTITLIPKVPNPSYPHQFIPISCCNVIYKLIAKILASRLQDVVPNVVNIA